MGKQIFAIAALLANIVPAPILDIPAAVCAFVHFAISPGKRRTVRENISAAGRTPGPRLVYGIFFLHAINIVEMIAASRWKTGDLEGRFDFENREAFDAALAEGKGVILVTQHTGSWEAGGVFLRLLGYRLHVVAGVQLSKFLTGAVKEAKERLGIEVINPEDPPRRLLKALASGGVLALLVDGNIYTGGTEIVFFGKKTRLPEGPAKLARASGAPIIAGYCRRTGRRRFSIHLERIMSGSEAASANESETLNRIYGAVERYIGENADQWVMFRRLWGNTQ